MAWPSQAWPALAIVYMGKLELVISNEICSNIMKSEEICWNPMKSNDSSTNLTTFTTSNEISWNVMNDISHDDVDYCKYGVAHRQRAGSWIIYLISNLYHYVIKIVILWSVIGVYPWANIIVIQQKIYMLSLPCWYFTYLTIWSPPRPQQMRIHSKNWRIDALSWFYGLVA